MGLKDANESVSADNNSGVSVLNTAGFINQRIHNIALLCQRRWDNGQFMELNNALDMFWIELFADASEPQRKKIKTYDLAILSYNKKMRLAKTKSDLLENKSKLILTIKDKWLYLKEIEKTQGLGKFYKDDMEDDFE